MFGSLLEETMAEILNNSLFTEYTSDYEIGETASGEYESYENDGNYDVGYNDGYDDGYEDGYEDGAIF